MAMQLMLVAMVGVSYHYCVKMNWLTILCFMLLRNYICKMNGIDISFWTTFQSCRSTIFAIETTQQFLPSKQHYVKTFTLDPLQTPCQHYVKVFTHATEDYCWHTIFIKSSIIIH
jgi:hypothetical protein